MSKCLVSAQFNQQADLQQLQSRNVMKQDNTWISQNEPLMPRSLDEWVKTWTRRKTPVQFDIFTASKALSKWQSCNILKHHRQCRTGRVMHVPLDSFCTFDTEIRLRARSAAPVLQLHHVAVTDSAWCFLSSGVSNVSTHPHQLINSWSSVGDLTSKDQPSTGSMIVDDWHHWIMASKSPSNTTDTKVKDIKMLDSSKMHKKIKMNKKITWKSKNLLHMFLLLKFPKGSRFKP